MSLRADESINPLLEKCAGLARTASSGIGVQRGTPVAEGEKVKILLVGGGEGSDTRAAFSSGALKVENYGIQLSTASRSASTPWPGSVKHLAGVDRNNSEGLGAMLEREKPRIVIDAAAASQNEAAKFKTVAEARAAGRKQAQDAINFLKKNPDATYIFISSQFANPEFFKQFTSQMMNQRSHGPEFSPLLYAEGKHAFESALLEAEEKEGINNFVIIRMGSLLTPEARSPAAESMVTTGEKIPGRNFIPESELSQSVTAIIQKLLEGAPVESRYDISSIEDFAHLRELGVKPRPLEVTFGELRRAWGLVPTPKAGPARNTSTSPQQRSRVPALAN